MAKAFPNTGVTTGLAADRTAMTGMTAGTYFYETDTKKTFVYNGSSWVEINDLDNLGGVSDGSLKRPMVRCVRSSDQAFNTGNNNNIAWDGTDSFDTDSMHNPSSNNTRITFNTAGIYYVTASIFLTAGIQTNCWIQLNGNAATRIVGTNPRSAGSVYNLSTLYKFSATDYIEVGTYGEANYTIDDAGSSFAAFYVGSD